MEFAQKKKGHVISYFRMIHIMKERDQLNWSVRGSWRITT